MLESLQLLRKCHYVMNLCGMLSEVSRNHRTSGAVVVVLLARALDPLISVDGGGNRVLFLVSVGGVDLVIVVGHYAAWAAASLLIFWLAGVL